MWFGYFFFKQKTAYEVRISDWSSDVCSSDLISTGDLSSLCDRLAQAGCAPQVSVRIDGGRAADIAFQGGPSTARKSLDGALAHTDVIVQPMATREKKLLIADMDSTMITVECLAEIGREHV